MINKHPLVDVTNYTTLMDREAQLLEVNGYKSSIVLKALFNLFTWQYMEGNIDKAGIDPRISDFFKGIDLNSLKGDSIAYSTILLYNLLSRKINMRSLEMLRLVDAVPGDNKVLHGEEFTYPELRDLYLKNSGDLSNDFMLFNDIFKQGELKYVDNMHHYGEISHATNVTDLVRPDFKYKLATKQLLVNKKVTNEGDGDKTIYVLQDSTHSMQSYIEPLKMIKGYILEEAFKYDHSVHWLYVSDKINHRVCYTKHNIKHKELNYDLSGVKVNTSKILIEDEFINKNVILITDGTDQFNFDFNTKTKKINVISFNDNKLIKDKISSYGRFFKVKL